MSASSFSVGSVGNNGLFGDRGSLGDAGITGPPGPNIVCYRNRRSTRASKYT